MKKSQKLLTCLFSLVCAVVVGSAATSMIARAEETPATIIDHADQVGGAGAPTQDIWSLKTSSLNNMGLEGDNAYSTLTAPTTSPTWDTRYYSEPGKKDSYAYAQYALSGQNVVVIEAILAPETVDCDFSEPVFCFTDKGTAPLKVSEMKSETIASSGWIKVTYTYEIPEATRESNTFMRVLPSIYNDANTGLQTWMQKISYVEISYVEKLPGDSSEETVDPLSVVQTDECMNNLEGGMRYQTYNVSIRRNNVTATGDANRIVFADPAKSESYIEYHMNNMDTLAVTTYEPLNEDGTRPENATQIKFCIFQNGKYVGWEKAATKIVVEDGDAVSGRWTKIVWYYTFDQVYEDARIRMVIYYPTEEQAEIEIGRVDIYNSEKADLTVLNAQEEIREYAYAKDFSQYNTENWGELINVMVAAVNELYTAEDVEAVVEKAKEDIDAVKILEDEPSVEVETITDDCTVLSGGVMSDLYSFALKTDDVGFGADSRYVTTKTPTEPITEATWWEDCYAYVEYLVSGQNLLTVVADMPADVLTKIPHIYVMAFDGINPEVNNYSVETSSDWARVTYKFIISENTTKVRVICGAYTAWDESVCAWQQQITSVTLEKVETLPEKDANIPEIEPAPEKPLPPPVDEATLKKVSTDNCRDNATTGPRADVFNVTVRADNVLATGDASRIVFGDNSGAQESYIDYKMDNMNTIAVTTYEPILEGNVRPESTTQIKFCMWIGRDCVAWERAATSTEVVLGDYEEGRWTKVVWYYTFEETFDSAKVRVMIFKPVEGQTEIEVGRVDVYHSEYADFSRMEAQAELQEYAYEKDMTDYTAENWENVIRVMAIAVEDINLAEDAAAIEAIMANAKAEMDAVKTFTMEFEANKESKKLQISEFAVNKGKKNYSEENWALIVAFAVEAQNKIDAATTMEEVDAILAEAKAKINQVEILKPETPPVVDDSSDTSEDETSDSAPAKDLASCFSGIEGAGMMMSALVASVACMLGKKKKEDNE